MKRIEKMRRQIQGFLDPRIILHSADITLNAFAASESAELKSDGESGGSIFIWNENPVFSGNSGVPRVNTGSEDTIAAGTISIPVLRDNLKAILLKSPNRSPFILVPSGKTMRLQPLPTASDIFPIARSMSPREPSPVDIKSKKRVKSHMARIESYLPLTTTAAFGIWEIANNGSSNDMWLKV